MKLGLALLISKIIAQTDMNIGVISDIHMDLNYSPTSTEKNCMNTITAAGSSLLNLHSFQRSPGEIALLGRLGCDAP